MKENPDKKPTKTQQFVFKNLEFLLTEPEPNKKKCDEFLETDKNIVKQLTFPPENKFLNVVDGVIDLCDSDENQEIEFDVDHNYFKTDKSDYQDVDTEPSIKTEKIENIDEDLEFDVLDDFDNNAEDLQLNELLCSENFENDIKKEETLLPNSDNPKPIVSSISNHSVINGVTKNSKKKMKSFDVEAVMHTEVPQEILKLKKTGNTKQVITEEAKIVYAAFSHVAENKKSLVFLKLLEAHEEFQSSLNNM